MDKKISGVEARTEAPNDARATSANGSLDNKLFITKDFALAPNKAKPRYIVLVYIVPAIRNDVNDSFKKSFESALSNSL